MTLSPPTTPGAVASQHDKPSHMPRAAPHHAPTPAPRPAAAATLVLEVSREGDVERIVQPNARGFIVGRDAAADLQLNHPSVSRRHASFSRLSDGLWVVGDLGSTNGTWINQQRVQSSRLSPMDAIQIGVYVLRLIPELDTPQPNSPTDPGHEALRAAASTDTPALDPATPPIATTHDTPAVPATDRTDSASSTVRFIAETAIDQLPRKMVDALNHFKSRVRASGMALSAGNDGPMNVWLYESVCRLAQDLIPGSRRIEVVRFHRAEGSLTSLAQRPAGNTAGAADPALVSDAVLGHRVARSPRPADPPPSDGNRALAYPIHLPNRDEAIALVVSGPMNELSEEAASRLKIIAATYSESLRQAQSLLQVDEYKNYCVVLRKAEQIHQSICPQPLRAQGIDAYLHVNPSESIGGDMADATLVDPTRVIFLIADATGHGFSAALLAVQLHALFRSYPWKSGSADELHNFLRSANDYLQAFSPDQMSFGAIAGCFDSGCGELTLTNCGHHPPVVRVPPMPRPPRSPTCPPTACSA